MAKHILVISQYFYPESFRINDICCDLVKRGYKVTVVTGIPNYPEGKFYPGYGWFRRRKETWNGIDIVRIPLTPRGKSSVGLFLNYLSFVVSGFFWKLFTRLKADYVFTFEVSPMTQALLGVWYAKRRKIPHYLYVQDLWPENVETVTGIHSKWVLGPISKMVNYIYKRCDKILATSPSFVDQIRERVSYDPGRVIYWPQYAEAFYQPLEKRSIPEIPEDGRFKIVFTGNIGQAQGLDILPQTARQLKDMGADTFRFVIVGNGRYQEQLLKEIAACAVEDMFLMIDRQPAERIPEILAACDAAFISFMDDPLFEKTIPAKLQSYMACGMPIVAAAKGETQKIIQEADCGVCCPIGDSKALAQALAAFAARNDLQSLSGNSRNYFLTHFEKVKVMDTFVELLESTQ